MAAKRVGDLDITQDLDFQRQEWRIQRIGWVVLLLIVLIAMLGLLGGQGPLSRGSVHAADGSLEVTYDRFSHFSEPTKLRIRVQALPDRELRLWFTRDYLQQFEIHQIIPEAQETMVEGDRLIYTFQLAEGQPEATIVFYLHADTFGSVGGQVGIDGGAVANVSHLIYP